MSHRREQSSPGAHSVNLEPIAMPQDLNYYVYIMASHKNGSIYTGMTNDLIRRVEEHKSGRNPSSHTSKYNIKRLVYFEIHNTAVDAILREKFVKKLTRARRIKLIEAENPNWQELFKGAETVPWM